MPSPKGPWRQKKDTGMIAWGIIARCGLFLGVIHGSGCPPSPTTCGDAISPHEQPLFWTVPAARYGCVVGTAGCGGESSVIQRQKVYHSPRVPVPCIGPGSLIIDQSEASKKRAPHRSLSRHHATP